MGRYYSGDINGKFMFGVQPSNAPERFGCRDDNATTIHYSIDKDDIDICKNELDNIKNNVKELFDIDIDEIHKKYYEEKDQFELSKYMNDKAKKLKDTFYSEFADYLLGMKIYNCLLENGECVFDADI